MFHRSSSRQQNQRRPGSRRQFDIHDGLHTRISQEARRKQRNQRLLICLSKLILLVGAVAGVFYGVRAGIDHFFWDNPKYRLATIEINNDGVSLTHEAIIEQTKLQLGVHVFEIDLATVRHSIGALPEVRDVDVRRILPDKISVSMSERRPVAWLADKADVDPIGSGNSYLVDPAGAAFKARRFVREHVALPVIYGVDPKECLNGRVPPKPEIAAALELILQNNELGRFQFLAIDVSKGYCMEVTDARYARITFGVDRIAQQFKRLNTLFDYLNANHQEIQKVNLMVERNTPVILGTPERPSALAVVTEGEEGRPAEAEALENSERPPAPEKAVAASTPPPPSVNRTKSASASAPKPSRRTAKPTPSRKVRVAKATPVRRATPVSRSAEPTVRRAQPVIRRAEPVSRVPLATAVRR